MSNPAIVVSLSNNKRQRAQFDAVQAEQDEGEWKVLIRRYGLSKFKEYRVLAKTIDCGTKVRFELTEYR
jgi:hypothetical protein